jgi:NhaA family Na+:H+ antiporter
MAIFFFLVGLEIKREVLEGHLSSRDQVVLPAFAAMGGMAAPAAIYVAIASSAPEDPEILNGWAIPVATDIAFALGALALVGAHVPLTLKVFLLSLAAFDDLGAIVIIAMFYTTDLSPGALVLAGAACALLFAMNRAGITRIAPYVFVGIASWVFVLKSGVHATLAGVALGLAIPLRDRSGEPIIERLEEALHPYVKWLILPLFAFANAGVSIAGFTASMLLEPLPLAIAAGLVVGKPLGVLVACFATVRCGIAKLPEGALWGHMAGVAALSGIGFTMSLFIGTLAFEADEHAAAVRIGVICGSLLAAAAGYLVLKLTIARTRSC